MNLSLGLKADSYELHQVIKKLINDITNSFSNRYSKRWKVQTETPDKGNSFKITPVL